MREDGRGLPHVSSRLLRQGLQAAGLGLLLAASWTVVYVGGGTHTALPHVFYIPIVLAALPFGLRGAVMAAVIATVACGPLMPLEVSSGTMQEVPNWVTRGVFFVATGVTAGTINVALRSSFERRLARHFGRELHVTAPDSLAVDEPSADQVRIVLATGAFHPVFQPVYSLHDGELVSVEALTRFDSDPAVPPNLWFMAAARAGLGADLELATMSAAIEAAQSQCPRTVALSVNVSPDLLADSRLLDLLDRVDGRRVIVEVTEHAAVDDYPTLDAAMARLRQRGVELAVDDTGAGFASLRHVVRLAPEHIKVDISLTQGLHHDPIRRGLARALVEFASETGVQLIAEGIEHPDDLTAWRALGAHAAQGYLLARPGPLPAAPHSSVILDDGAVPDLPFVSVARGT